MEGPRAAHADRYGARRIRHYDIDLAEPIALLDIPAGKVELQRLIYWHFLTDYYSPALNFDEMNHVNYDWYLPQFAHRQVPEEARSWCAELGLPIERERVEEAGISVVARRLG